MKQAKHLRRKKLISESHPDYKHFNVKKNKVREENSIAPHAVLPRGGISLRMTLEIPNTKY